MKSILFILLLIPSLAMSAVPTQWIGKLYTEVLGRAPDSTGWTYYVDVHFSGGVCNQLQLRGIANGLLTSSEFTNKSYGNEEKVLVLHRIVHGREPNSVDYSSDLNLLNSGTTWSQLVTSTLNSAFTASGARTNSICNNTLEGWGTNDVIQPPTTSNGYFSGGTGAQLQAVIDAAQPGSTVYLEKRAVVTITTPLVIKQNVRLSTVGNPDMRHYASMARLIRKTNSNVPLVIPLSGSTLSSVWVDGQWDRYTPTVEKYNVQVRRYNGTTRSDDISITNNRISNSAGGANIASWGTGASNPCTNLYIANNLITSYSGEHFSGGVYTDGIRVGCEDAYVTENHILDSTDVGIVVFRAGSATQKSIIYNNDIVNAGNSAYGGIVVDQLHDFSSGGNFNFTGSEISYNKVWSSKSAHFGAVLSVGTKPWFGLNTDYGYGTSFHHNTTAGIRTNANMGISVSRMSDSNIQSNVLLMNAGNYNSGCPIGNIVTDDTSNLNIQPGSVAVNMTNCMGH